MTFSAKGYLSEDLIGWKDSIRGASPHWFAFCEQLNRVAMAHMASLSPNQTRRKEVVTAAFFARCMQTFQAVILLAEKGMIADARTLVRSCAETAIILGGLALKEDMLVRLEEDKYRHYIAHGSVLLESAEMREGVAEESVAECKRLLDEAKAQLKSRPRQLKLDQLAADVGMGKLYNTLYRQISGDSAHPTLEAVSRHIDRDSDGRVIKLIFKPQVDGITETLLNAVQAVLYGIEATGEVFARPEMKGFAEDYCGKFVALAEVANWGDA